MNTKMKKIISLVVVLTFIFSFSTTVFSAPVNNTKEEVVYVLLNEDGTAKSVYVVNSYENQKGDFVDYGEYHSVRNLSTTDNLKNENGMVTGTISSGKFYYEGKMTNTEIPWNIDIEYTLDQKPITAKELAGKSGALQIGISISQNINANPTFFENYALQISVILDTNKCQNIVAEGATIANVGESKNIAYTLLPKKNGDYKITADVDNFEMGAISINGIPFSMKVNLEGIDNMTSGLTGLTDGIAKLDDGAIKLQKGAKELQQGVNVLNSQSGILVNGSSEVLNALNQINKGVSSIGNLTSATGGITQLQVASAQYATGINELASKCQILPQSSQAIYEGIKNSYAGLSSITAEDEAMEALLSKLSAMNDQNVNSLINAYKTKMGAASSVATGIAALQAQYSKFNTAISELSTAAKALSEGYAQIHTGIESLNMSINGLSELSAAINTLASQYMQLNNGIIEYTIGYSKIVSGYNEVYSGVVEITNGTAELRDNTKDLDKDINDKVDSALSEFQGGDFTPISFVSPKNTNISAVQFVMKTDDIQLPQQVIQIDEQSKKLSFWEKLVALFKKQG
jgi:putative membrane protein